MELHSKLERIVRKHIDDINTLPEPVKSLLQEINSDYLNPPPAPHALMPDTARNDHEPDEDRFCHDLLFFIDGNDI
ncbi:MAG TPA: hypothetical protein PK200_15690, partial [Spirochaetota bacterium]|nr:hypothetical protein [Spirochaetota bacterium]